MPIHGRITKKGGLNYCIIQDGLFRLELNVWTVLDITLLLDYMTWVGIDNSCMLHIGIIKNK